MPNTKAAASGLPDINRRKWLTTLFSGSLGLTFLPMLLSACSDSTKQTPNGQNPAPATAVSKAPAQSANGTANQTVTPPVTQTTDPTAKTGTQGSATGDAPTVAAQPGDSTPDPLQPPAAPTPAATAPQNVATTPSGATVDPRVKGAAGSAFLVDVALNNLSLAQIQADKQIDTTCQFGLHKVTILPKHLEALARGESITFESEVTGHIGQSGPHSHTITYKPNLS